MSAMKNLVYQLLSKWHVRQTQPAGPGLDGATIGKYNASRGKPSSKHICHAPFSNMYFNVHGDCAPCWLTFIEPDSYPNKSIREIWFGEKYQALRKHLLTYDLTHKCNVCLKNLQGGNYTSVLARAYDVNQPAEYPQMMELELSNTCNLECVMCIGELSSSIRKNRERLPAIKNAYDDKFVEQLEEFIPHLKELRFNGGEPFLINAVFKIFEKVEKLNPKLKIVIATNGTVLNYKVKEWLNKLNIHINFSLDSLTPEIYETIRVNAHFDRVIENFHFYRDYTRANNRTMCLMVNPMRNNWHEMPEFIKFVNKHNINIWFNTIHRPVDWAIWPLPHNELANIYEKLTTAEFTGEHRSAPLASYNIGIYKNLVNVQIKNWVAEAQERESSEIPVNEALTEEMATALFTKKMTDFVYSTFNEGEEQKKYRLKTVFEKTTYLSEAITNRNPSVEFYKAVADVPASVFYQQISERSTNSLVEDFENRVMSAAS
ncbi:MAG TPA: radical SAM protein [Chitinophagales bacterium]|nr:radical SAM protein [Chitinophagales bacterium]